MKVFYKNALINTPAETDYNNVLNLPEINGVKLEDNKNTEEIKITKFYTLEEFELLGSYDSTTLYIIDDGVPAGITKNYFFKTSKPSINGVELEGAKLSSDLNFYTRDEFDNLMASMRSLKVVSEKPTAPLANTMYYVGPKLSPTGEEIYDVYLYDSSLAEIYLGTTYTQVLKDGDGSIVRNNVVSVNPDNVSINTNGSNELQIKWLADKTAGADDSKPVYLQNDVLKSFTHTIFDLIYPVGSIYKTTTLTTAAQVAAKFGGVWGAWAVGKIPVGVDTSQTEFNTVEKIGGEKKHQLTLDEMPSHTHDTLYLGISSGSSIGFFGREGSRSGILNHPQGSNQSHNNLMPYITCYMWQRIS